MLKTIPFKKIRRLAAISVTLGVVFLLWTWSFHRRSPSSSINFSESRIETSAAKVPARHAKLRGINGISEGYLNLLSQTNLEQLEKSSISERCNLYFNHLQIADQNWIVDPNEDISFNKDAFQSEGVFFRRKQEIEKEKRKQAKISHKFSIRPSEAELRQECQTLRSTMLKGESKMQDYITHVRVFDKCVLSRPEMSLKEDDVISFQKQGVISKKGVESAIGSREKARALLKNPVSCSDTQNRIFPWLTSHYPIFTRWDGKTTYFPGSATQSTESECFLRAYKAQLNGKGIVITINEDYAETAIRFLRTLRYLGNKYPIQIVYYADLSQETREQLVRIARDDFRGYPTQELWFVDVEPAINLQYKDKFVSFGNKILAMMFNSFEEVLLCDADAVLVKNPSDFFTLKKYLKTGAMFYKDRYVGSGREASDYRFLHKLLPAVEDTLIFNISQTTDVTLNNEFFEGGLFQMESGVVVMNRKKHFIQPLMMSTMNFYDPIRLRLFGDKELFWLALAFAGDENYAFDDNPAGAIGELTPEIERQTEKGKARPFRSREICSSHPAHISDVDNRTLLWFDSGFRHCGNSFGDRIDWEKEQSNKVRYSKFKTTEELKTHFRSQLRITHAIIPPVPINHQTTANYENEPELPWEPKGYCDNYCWCGMSSIGGQHFDAKGFRETYVSGKLIEFSPGEINQFEAIGEVWMLDP